MTHPKLTEMKFQLTCSLAFLPGCATSSVNAQQSPVSSITGQCFSQWTAAMDRQEKRQDESEEGREEISDLIHHAELPCVTSCNQGNVPACLKLTQLYENDDGCPAAIDPVQERDWTRCSDDDQTDATRETLIRTVYEKSQLLMQKTCNEGRLESCNKLGVLYLYIGEGKLPGGTALAAAELFATACDKENFSACYNLADLYAQGKGVTMDTQKADELKRRAHKLAAQLRLTNDPPKCSSGDMDACYRLGIVYEWEMGVESDMIRAKELFSMACNQGHATSCDELARIRERDPNKKKGKAAAKVLYQRACELGESAGCDNLRLLNSGATVRISSSVRIISTAGDMYEQLFISDEYRQGSSLF